MKYLVISLLLIACNVSAETRYTVGHAIKPAWLFAVINSKYEDPNIGKSVPEYPLILEMPKAAILATTGCKEYCGDIVGHYKNNTIYVATELTQSIRLMTGLLVHEFVHYLQDINGVPRDTCRQRMETEKEAYYIEFLYMNRNRTVSMQAIRYMEQEGYFDCRNVPQTNIQASTN